MLSPDDPLFDRLTNSMIEVYAPGRAELLGNHTDYNEGYVLAIAVERGVTVRGQIRSDNRITLEAQDLGERWEGPVAGLAPGPQGWVNYVTGVVAQFQKRGWPVKGFELSISSNLPMGAGLSSSAALEVATALFLQEALGFSLEKMDLARMAQAAEHEFVGVKCGLLDQIASLYGQKDTVTFIDCRSYEVQNIPVPASINFVIANSGAKHALVTGEYNERRESCEAAARALGAPFLRDVSTALLREKASLLTPLQEKRARHVVGENERVLTGVEALNHGAAVVFGDLMYASHESSRLNFENSCPELDALVERAKQAAVWGARLSGGGFGGATINLVAADRLTDVVRMLGVEALVTKAAAGAARIS